MTSRSKLITFAALLVLPVLAYLFHFSPAQSQSSITLQDEVTATWINSNTIKIEANDVDVPGFDINLKSFEGEYKYSTPCGRYDPPGPVPAGGEKCVNTEDGKLIFQKSIGNKTCGGHNTVYFDSPLEYEVNNGTNRILATEPNAPEIYIKWRVLISNDARGESDCIEVGSGEGFKIPAKSGPNGGALVIGEWVASNAIKIYRDNQTYFKSDSDPNIFIGENDKDKKCPAILKLNNKQNGEGNDLATYYVLEEEGSGGAGGLRQDCGDLGVTNDAVIVASENKDKEELAPSSGEDGEQPETCASKSGISFGWIVCPVVEAGLGIMDWLFENLIMSVLRLNIEDTGPLLAVWSAMRFIANLFFVVAFFVVIYSAATGNVLSAYDVRKLLPRIFIIAILVQLSFYLSMLALTLSNEIGDSVSAIFKFAAGGQDSLDLSSIDYFNNDLLGAIGGVAVAGLVIVALLAALIYSFVGVIMLMGAFLIRDMGIIILIVISPIAFALAILPGTEDFFRKWWKWLFGLLAMYPIMQAFLSAGALAGTIIRGSGMFGSPFIANLVAMVLLFLPFFIAPYVLKFAGVAAASLNGAFKAIQQNGGKVFGEDGAIRGSEGYKRYKAKAAAGRALPDGSRLSGLNRGLAVVHGGKGQFRPTRRGRQLAASRAESAARSIEDEDTKIDSVNLLDQLRGIEVRDPATGNVDYAATTAARQQRLREISTDTGQSRSMRLAAMNRMVMENDFAGLRMASEQLNSTGEGDLWDQVKETNASALGTKAPHLLKTGLDQPYRLGAVSSLGALDLSAMHPNGLTDALAVAARDGDAATVAAVLDNYTAGLSDAAVSGKLSPAVTAALSGLDPAITGMPGVGAAHARLQAAI